VVNEHFIYLESSHAFPFPSVTHSVEVHRT
jgi:hypothetical protein